MFPSLLRQAQIIGCEISNDEFSMSNSFEKIRGGRGDNYLGDDRDADIIVRASRQRWWRGRNAAEPITEALRRRDSRVARQARAPAGAISMMVSGGRGYRRPPPAKLQGSGGGRPVEFGRRDRSLKSAEPQRAMLERVLSARSAPCVPTPRSARRCVDAGPRRPMSARKISRRRAGSSARARLSASTSERASAARARIGRLVGYVEQSFGLRARQAPALRDPPIGRDIERYAKEVGARTAHRSDRARPLEPQERFLHRLARELRGSNRRVRRRLKSS